MTTSLRQRRRLHLPAALLCLFWLSACVSSGDTLAEARKALGRGEYERAHVLYNVAGRSGTFDYLTKQEAELALRRAVDGRLERARAAEYQGDFAGALMELRAANEFAPGDERISQERDRISREENRVKRDLRQAGMLLSQGRAREAHGILEPLGGKGRVSPDYETMLRQSEAAAEQQVETARATERLGRIESVISTAERAWRRGNHGEALLTISRGRRDLGDDPAFEERSRPWRYAVRRHFLDLATAETGAGRHATALLLAKAALAADPGNHDARVAVERMDLSAAPALTWRVKVSEFSDETGGRVDPLRFQRSLVAALEHPFTEFTVSSGKVDLAIYGSVKALDITSPNPRIENRVHEYVVRTEQEVNPEHERANRRVAEARRRLDDRESTFEPVQRELYELERLENQAIVGGSGRRQFGPYNEAAYYRMLANGRSRAARARRSVETAREELRSAERNADGIPYYLDRKIIGQVPYTVRTISKTGVATAFYAVSRAGRETEEQNPSGTETIRVTVLDSTHEGLPTAGLAPDPLEIPDDVELGELALDDLVVRLAARVLSGIDRKRLTLLEEGRTLMRNGDEPAALDRYAAFLLTTGDVLTLERGTAARRILGAFGVEVTTDGVGIRSLRIEGLGTD